MKYQAVKGMKDILPGDVDRWRLVEDLARDFFPRFGYQELRTPILEKTELFIRSIGDTTDVVEKEMYTLTDMAGDSLTMRPEATAAVCRAYVEHKLYKQPGGWKVFNMGPMFRHEKPQAGRFRQFHQIDCEVLGVEEGEADAELISMLVGFLETAGVTEVSIKLNSLGCPDCRPAYREKLIAYLNDSRDQLCEDCQRRLDKNPLRVLDCKNKTCKSLADGAPASADHLCAKCEANFTVVRNRLDDFGIEYHLDHRLVRGLDYYVGTTFEAVSGKLGGQDAVTGGGRYDGLISELGGPDHPATGFAIGIERLLMLSDLEPQPNRPDLYIAALGDEARNWAAPAAYKLRLAGMKVELEMEAKSLKAQMRRANKLESAYVLIVGQSELEAGEGQLKKLEDGSQETVKLDGIIEALSTRLG